MLPAPESQVIHDSPSFEDQWRSSLEQRELARNSAQSQAALASLDRKLKRKLAELDPWYVRLWRHLRPPKEET